MKHILLTFLSDVKTNWNSELKQVEISKANYEGIGETFTTNESGLKYLLKSLKENGEKIDKIVALVTNKVEMKKISVQVYGKEIEYVENDKKYTHMKYFEKRIGNFFDLKKDFAYESFDENLPAEKTVGYVVEFADKVQKYIDEFGKVNVILDVDISGGMRNVNMVILSILRLLEYNGVKIGKVLYSNFKKNGISIVEELTDTYKLFNLMAGAEEFVRFGSVSAILEYYKDHNIAGTQLEKLLNAMEQFSKEIKLCRYGKFVEAIENLRENIRAFKASKEKNQAENTIYQMMNRIELEYDALIKNETLDDLDLIEWCINRDYFQQAITLYTERIPECLCEHQLIYQDEDGRKDLLTELSRDEMKRKQNFYLLNDYKNSEEQKSKYNSTLDSIKQKLVKSIRMLFNEIENKQLTIEQVMGKISDFQNKYKIKLIIQSDILQAFTTLLRLKDNPAELKDNQCKDIWINRIIEKIREYDKENNTALGNYYDAENWGKKKYKKIINYLQEKITAREIIEVFNINRGYASTRIYHLLDDKKIFTKANNLAKLFEIIEIYTMVKTERNISNHAKEEKSQYTGEELKEKMLRGVTLIRELADEIK